MVLIISRFFGSPFEDPKLYSHGVVPSPVPGRKKSNPKRIVTRLDSVTAEEKIGPSNPHDAVEYFFASDASAIIEHTDRVIYLEDDDVAAVNNGILSLHRANRDESNLQTTEFREVTTLKMEIQQIMKGNYSRYEKNTYYIPI